MIDLLLNLGGGICCVYLGWQWRARQARRHEQLLDELLRESRARIEATIYTELKLKAEIRQLGAALQSMNAVAVKFRDAFLGALSHVAPDRAAELRTRWAAMDAPLHVAKMLELCSRG